MLKIINFMLALGLVGLSSSASFAQAIAQDQECVYKTKYPTGWAYQALQEKTGTKLSVNPCEVGTRAESEIEIACQVGAKVGTSKRYVQAVINDCERFSYDSELQNSCEECGKAAVNKVHKDAAEKAKRTAWDFPRNPKF